MEFNKENFDLSIAKNAALLKEINSLSEEIEELKFSLKLQIEKYKNLLKQKYGAKSEKIDPNQLQLILDNILDLQSQVEVLAEKPLLNDDDDRASKRGKRTPIIQRVPKDILIKEEIQIPAEVQANPELYKEIGEEILDELEVIPTQYFIRRIIRKKFARIDDKSIAPIIAPAPKSLIPNSYASASLVLQVLLRKYCDHIPLYRQEQALMQRHGIEISRKTMSSWMMLIANWLSMIYNALSEEIRSSGYMQIDETHVKYIEPGKGSCPTGYLWTYHNPRGGVLFQWHPSRASSCLDSMLTNYKGLIQTDGYNGYTSWLGKGVQSQENPDIIHASCWAHARRKFIDAPRTPKVEKVIKLISELYRNEKLAKNKNPEERAEYRQLNSVLILDKIKTLLCEEQYKERPITGFAKAINYTLERWEGLTKYVNHGLLEIDNNLVENAIRPIAIGKKNFLFFGSSESGQTSAIIVSLIETCRKLDLNPKTYLSELFAALPTMMQSEAKSWTPSKWKEAQNNQ